MAAQIHVAPHSLPRFYKARTVPHALQGRVKQELEWLHEEELVEFVEWAAPIEWLYWRICGDYEVTVSRVAKVDIYSLPRIEDRFASLAGGKLFSKLDLAPAYLKHCQRNQGSVWPLTPIKGCIGTTGYPSAFHWPFSNGWSEEFCKGALM